MIERERKREREEEESESILERKSEKVCVYCSLTHRLRISAPPSLSAVCVYTHIYF